MNVKIGSQVGNWKVISEKYKKDDIYWNDCECICGKVIPVRTWHLNNSKSKSCGCTNIKGRFLSKCVGDLSSSYISTIKYKRTSKGMIFSEEVTMEYLWELFQKQEGACAISGIPIFLNPRWSAQNQGTKTDIIQTASLDRIDSYKSYEIGNVQWVHKDINMMKGSINQNDFIMFCKKVAEHNIGNDYDVDFEGPLKYYKINRKDDSRSTN
jgi:hypothetical protein